MGIGYRGVRFPLLSRRKIAGARHVVPPPSVGIILPEPEGRRQ